MRELCDEFGALLIFDEVVTGFRLGLGGAQGYFGVKPDLTVFGKCISGGYPMAGGVGGRRDVMMSFAAGIGGKSGERAYVGGTLSANPLSCAAGYYALLEMERTNAPVVAGRAGDRLTRGPAGDHRAPRPALCRLQPGLDRPPRDLGRDAARPAQPGAPAPGSSSRAST